MSFLPLAVSSTLVSFLWPRRRATSASRGRRCSRPEEASRPRWRTHARAVVELLLANLLLCFDWRAPHGHGEVDVAEENALTVHRKNPLVLVAKRRCVRA